MLSKNYSTRVFSSYLSRFSQKKTLIQIKIFSNQTVSHKRNAHARSFVPLILYTNFSDEIQKADKKHRKKNVCNFLVGWSVCLETPRKDYSGSLASSGKFYNLFFFFRANVIQSADFHRNWPVYVT